MEAAGGEWPGGGGWRQRATGSTGNTGGIGEGSPAVVALGGSGAIPADRHGRGNHSFGTFPDAEAANDAIKAFARFEFLECRRFPDAFCAAPTECMAP